MSKKHHPKGKPTKATAHHVTQVAHLETKVPAPTCQDKPITLPASRSALQEAHSQEMATRASLLESLKATESRLLAINEKLLALDRITANISYCSPSPRHPRTEGLSKEQLLRKYHKTQQVTAASLSEATTEALMAEIAQRLKEK